MQLELFTVCRKASFDPKTNYFNIETGSVDAETTPPNQLPFSTSLQVAASILFEPLEDGPHQASVSVVDEDGTVIWKDKGADCVSIVPNSSVGLVWYKLQLHLPLLTRLFFPDFGTYAFHLHVDGEFVAERPYHLIERIP